MKRLLTTLLLVVGMSITMLPGIATADNSGNTSCPNSGDCVHNAIVNLGCGFGEDIKLIGQARTNAAGMSTTLDRYLQTDNTSVYRTTDRTVNWVGTWKRVMSMWSLGPTVSLGYVLNWETGIHTWLGDYREIRVRWTGCEPHPF